MLQVTTKALILIRPSPKGFLHRVKITMFLNKKFLWYSTDTPWVVPLRYPSGIRGEKKGRFYDKM
jgi:hypothetical protein